MYFVVTFKHPHRKNTQLLVDAGNRGQVQNTILRNIGNFEYKIRDAKFGDVVKAVPFRNNLAVMKGK